MKPVDQYNWICPGKDGNLCNVFHKGGFYVVPPVINGTLTCPICGLVQTEEEAKQLKADIDEILRKKWKKESI